jgi:hypothetical protein
MSDINLPLLKTEAELPKYNGMSDEQIAAEINATPYSIPKDIDQRDAVPAMIFTPSGDWGKICGVSDGVISASQSIRVQAISIRELFKLPTFVATDEGRWAAFVAAYAAIRPSVTSQEGLDAITALRYRSSFLWEKFGFRELDFNDIAQARAV